MRKKNIWIINEYAGSPWHGMEYRHFYLSKALQKLGYDVTIISASYSHLFQHVPKINQRFTFEEIEGVRYLWIQVPIYSSAHSKKRVLKWFVFTASLFFLPVKKLPWPDYILVSPMQTMPFYPAYRWAKKFHAKIIFEVKDIWPLSIIELGGYSPVHPFIRWLKYFEKMAIQKSDAIVSVLPNYKEYLKNEGFERNFHYIPNGVDFNELEHSEQTDLAIENQLPKNKFIVGYTGTLGKANAMYYFIAAADILKEYAEIAFVIVGEGSEKNKLIETTKQHHLQNVFFFPPIPKKQIQSVLQKFDVCYIGLEQKDLFKYGISPNKLFDYMQAAKPILLAIHSKNNAVERAQCGICVEDISAENIAQAILQLYHTPPEMRKEMGQRGKEYVWQHHTFDVLAQKYHQLFMHL